MKALEAEWNKSQQQVDEQLQALQESSSVRQFRLTLSRHFDHAKRQATHLDPDLDTRSSFKCASQEVKMNQ
jgi:hypothetical protein